jgi:Ala-tRNA(Pro) deacylase
LTQSASNKVLDMLAAAGIAVRVVEHWAVFTVAESTALRDDLPGLHCKNLFLRAAKGEGFFLATLEADRVLSVNSLARAAGWPKVRMASAEELLATLGVTPGSVTPLGLVNAMPGSVQFAIDAAIAQGPDPLWCHPLRNDASVAVPPEALRTFLENLGHQVQVVPL